MTSAVSIFDKFSTASSSVPWPAIAGARFSTTVMEDIDGDGRAECIAVIPDPNGIAPPTWGVLSYFSYADYYSGWATANAAPLDANWSTPYDCQLISSFCSLPSVVPGTPPAPLIQAQGRFRSLDENVVLLLDGTSRSLSLVVFAQVDQNVAGTLPPPPQTIFRSSGSSVPGSGQVSAWTVDGSQTLAVGDVDGDGLDEIVITQAGVGMAVLKWSAAAGSLVVIDTVAQLGVCSFATPSQLWTGDVDGDGAAEIILLTGMFQFGMLRFSTSGGLQLAQFNQTFIPPAQAGGASFSLIEQVRVAIGDLDGDGRQEVLLAGGQSTQDGTEGVIGVVSWTDGALSVASIATGTISSGIGDWTIPAQQSIAIGQVQASGSNVLVCVSDALGLSSISMLGYSASSGLSVLYQSGVMIEAAGAAGSFMMMPGTTFGLADVDGDGVHEIILQSDVGQQLAVARWSGSDRGLTVSWLAGSAQSSVPLSAWGLGFMAQAPSNTASAWLNADQQAIYGQISASLSPAPPEPVRSTYANGANVDANFVSWIGQLQDQVRIIAENRKDDDDQWPWITNYAATDVAAVFNQIIQELNGTSELYSLTTYYGLYLVDVQAQRGADIATVIANLGTTPPDPTPMTYWPGQIVIAALWGLAAVAGTIETGGIALAAGLSTFASLLGSALSAPASDEPRPSDPSITMEYEQLQKRIDKEATTVTDVFATQMADFIADPVRLAMLGPLLLGPWPTYTYQTLSTIPTASPYNRLVFYQALLGTQFQWSHWAMTVQTTPWIISWNSLGRTSLEWLTVPAGSVYVSQGVYPGGQNDMYMLQQLNTPVVNPTLPSEDLVTDLFASINVQISDVVANARGWSVPLFEWAKGDDLGTYDDPDLHLYVMNDCASSIWYTLYYYSQFEGGVSHIKESGAVAPGEMIQSSNTYDFTSGDTYKITAQYAEQGGEVPYTVGQVVISESGATMSYNNWLRFSGTSASNGWDCLNPGSDD